MTQLNRVSMRRRDLLIAAGVLTGTALSGRALAQAKTKVAYGQGSIDPIFTAGYSGREEGLLRGGGSRRRCT